MKVELPTVFGSVIGYAKYFKGKVHYYTAVLSQGIQGSDLWWVSGEEDPYEPSVLEEEFGPDWTYIGIVEIDAEALDTAMVLDRERNSD